MTLGFDLAQNTIARMILCIAHRPISISMLIRSEISGGVATRPTKHIVLAMLRAALADTTSDASAKAPALNSTDASAPTSRTPQPHSQHRTGCAQQAAPSDRQPEEAPCAAGQQPHMRMHVCVFVGFE